MKKTTLSLVSILFLGVIILLVNSISSLGLSRFYFDLTEDSLYTLSDGSKNIISNLKDNVVLKTYISKTYANNYPAIKLYGDRIISLLKEYAKKSNGKIKLEIFDPLPDTDEEIWAQKFGITPLAMPEGEKLYFGLAAINSRGAEEVLPVFSLTRQEALEYDVSKILQSLSFVEKPTIGIISPLNIKGEENPNLQIANPNEQTEPWVLINQLSKVAEIEFLNADIAQIDPKIKLLMLIHPKGLSPKTLYAIDQFVLSGGNLFVAIDPYCSADQPASQNPQMNFSYDHSSNLKELLSNWGVDLVEKNVVGDINLSTRVSTQRGAMPDDYVVWLNLVNQANPDLINKDDMLTSELDNILFPWAGALNFTPKDNIKFEPLFSSTQEAMLIDESNYKFNGGSPEALIEKYTKGDKKQVIAARISGKFKSNFAQMPKDDQSANTNTENSIPPHLSESKDVSNIVVVADVDFMTDYAATVSQNILGTRLVSLSNDNLAFVTNVAENLLGSSDLISLRSRGKFSRPFIRVQALERQAEMKFRKEEMTFQASLNSANQRLNQLLGGNPENTSEKAEQALNSAVLDEIKSLREERAVAQEKLRQVRKNLRQDKEKLGKYLFALNTFLVPCLLIMFAVLRNKKKLN